MGGQNKTKTNKTKNHNNRSTQTDFFLFAQLLNGRHGKAERDGFMDAFTRGFKPPNDCVTGFYVQCAVPGLLTARRYRQEEKVMG